MLKHHVNPEGILQHQMQSLRCSSPRARRHDCVLMGPHCPRAPVSAWPWAMNTVPAPAELSNLVLKQGIKVMAPHFCPCCSPGYHQRLETLELFLSLTGRTGPAALARTGIAPSDATKRILNRILNAACFQRVVYFSWFVQLAGAAAQEAPMAHAPHKRLPPAGDSRDAAYLLGKTND